MARRKRNTVTLEAQQIKTRVLALADSAPRGYTSAMRAMGIDPSVISDLRTDEGVPHISADKVIRLAKFFDVRPGWLLTGEPPERGEIRVVTLSSGSASAVPLIYDPERAPSAEDLAALERETSQRPRRPKHKSRRSKTNRA